MYFKRKAYDRLLEWKAKYSDKYAALLEGAKRVGKSTIAESFGQNEYKSYLLIDFSKTTDNIRSCFEDVGNLNMFFLRLQAETGVTLYEHESYLMKCSFFHRQGRLSSIWWQMADIVIWKRDL